jgi:hypothetical protein
MEWSQLLVRLAQVLAILARLATESYRPEFCSDASKGNVFARSSGSLYAKRGVKFTLEFLQGEEPDDIPTDMLQHPIKVVVPANGTSSGMSGSSTGRLALGGLMNTTSM